MQIASGWSKGLKILTPLGNDTRPTRERVRSSALNMLQPWIEGARVLDLFAGSGAVGLELISRGASGSIFVENNKAAIQCITSNMQGLKERAARESLSLEPFQLVPSDAAKSLVNLGAASFDLIWADPPYEAVQKFLEEAAGEISRLLKEDGVFALESSTNDLDLLESMTTKLCLPKIKQRAYGVSLITIWQKET